MEFVSVLWPFFAAGLVVAVLSRFTGAAMSLLMVPTLLYWGARPVDVVAFMVTFVLYNNFTSETQDVRLSLKELVFFKKWRIAIPFVLFLVLLPLGPQYAVGVFLFCFVAELMAALYFRIPEDRRPTVSQVVTSSVVSAIACVIGVVLFPFIPANVFFIVAGIVALLLTAFAWYAARHRGAFRGTWNWIWSVLPLLLGLFGLEISSYVRGTERDYPSRLDRMIPAITVVGALAGALTVFVTYQTFSAPSLVAAVGAAFGIRMFGVYEFTRRGQFSYAAIGLVVLAVLCLFLVMPTPVGFPAVDAVMR
ncbi:MAG: hypothetical protein KA077_04180 [Veillonella sp.]|jgi:uncharacterized membrane protein YfcA|nr:hypothetical protein [Veillonella sp.]